MWCYRCGKQIPDGSRYCAGCGAPQMQQADLQRPLAARAQKQETISAPTDNRGANRRKRIALFVVLGIWTAVLVLLIVFLLSNRSEKKNGNAAEPLAYSSGEDIEEPVIVSPADSGGENEDTVEPAAKPSEKAADEQEVQEQPTSDHQEAEPSEQTNSHESQKTVSAQPAANSYSLKPLNIFLSNFTETWIESFHPKEESEFDLLKYVLIHYIINDYERVVPIRYDGMEYFSMDKAIVDNCIQRFFDISIEPKDYYAGEENRSGFDYFYFRDGMYLYPAAYGESYNRFSVVSDVKPQSDGTNIVYYEVYELELGTYFALGMPDALYCYRADTIQNCGYEVERVGSGIAIVKGDLTESDSLNWRLLDLQAD